METLIFTVWLVLYFGVPVLVAVLIMRYVRKGWCRPRPPRRSWWKKARSRFPVPRGYRGEQLPGKLVVWDAEYCRVVGSCRCRFNSDGVLWQTGPWARLLKRRFFTPWDALSVPVPVRASPFQLLLGMMPARPLALSLPDTQSVILIDQGVYQAFLSGKPSSREARKKYRRKIRFASAPPNSLCLLLPVMMAAHALVPDHRPLLRGAIMLGVPVLLVLIHTTWLGWWFLADRWTRLMSECLGTLWCVLAAGLFAVTGDKAPMATGWAAFGLVPILAGIRHYYSWRWQWENGQLHLKDLSPAAPDPPELTTETTEKGEG